MAREEQKEEELGLDSAERTRGAEGGTTLESLHLRHTPTGREKANRDTTTPLTKP